MEGLFEAARTGNVELLHDLLRENPLALIDAALSSSKDTPLHVATKSGQLSFVSEILKHKPEFAREMNKDGYRPLDIAAITGHIGIVRELLKIDPQICRLQGKHQRTALHHAAAYGRVEIINALLSACPKSVTDVTVCGETALHLAVTNNEFQAFSILIEWLQILKEENVLNFCDCDGNTVLHLATALRQLNTTELLLVKNKAFNGTLEVNATNSKGLTPMDILEVVIEDRSDFQIRKILQHAGALGSQEAVSVRLSSSLKEFTRKKPGHEHGLTSGHLMDWFKYFKFQLDRDSPSDTRNVLLVVAALIASATFQAGLNPPKGLLEYNSQSASNTTGTDEHRTNSAPVLTSGLATVFALLGTQATAYCFLFGNTLGLTASLSIVMYLTAGFPFQRELLISIFSMFFAYGFSFHGIAEKDGVAYALLSVAFILPFALRWLPNLLNKAWKWLRGSSTIRQSPDS